MLSRNITLTAALTIVTILGCQKKAQGQKTYELTSQKPSAPADDTTNGADSLPDLGNEIPLEQTTVEPKCPTPPTIVPNLAQSALTPAGDFLLTCLELFTGFDGVHTYKVPINVAYVMKDPNATAPSLDSPLPVLTVEDPTVISAAFVATPSDILPEKDISRKYVMITSKKPGTSKITFTFNGLTAYCKVKVNTYSSQQYDIGKKRYEDPVQDKLFDPAGRKSCISCHAGGGTSTAGEGQAPDHDPVILGIQSDDHLRLKSAFDKVCDIKGEAVSANASKWHVWSFTKDELDGLPAYLRSLPPKGF